MAAAVVMTTKPLWLQNLTGYVATDLRSMLDADYYEGVDNYQNDFQIQQRGAGTNMSVDVNGGIAVIQGNSPAGSRKYLVRDDTEICANVTLDAAPGSNSRIDLIVATVRDAAVGGGSFNDWVLVAVTGTSGASPSPPSVPNNSIELARVLVAHGTSAITNAMITDRRTCMHRFKDGFNALPAQVISGQVITDYGTGRLYRGAPDSSGYIDLHALVMELTTRSGGSIIGGTPAPNTVYKWEPGTKGITFTAGAGSIPLDSTFTGILFFSATAIGNGKTYSISRRTSGSGTPITGTSIPITALEHSVFGNANASGTITVSYFVIGW